jgi:glycosyltransferase involved in cell wall biosynthesis
VPCFNEAAVVTETAAQLTGLLDRLVAAGTIAGASRVYFVDDGSSDATWDIVELLHKSDERVCGIKLSANRGHQNALLAGLLAAEGDVIVSIDADLQDDVDSIEAMIHAWETGCDIVYGVRAARSEDTFFKRSSAWLYYRLMAAMGVRVVMDHADFRLMSRTAIEALRAYPEVNVFLRGIIPLLGFRSARIEYARKGRIAGESKYPLRRMISLGVQGVTSFSAVPLRLITALGFLVSIGSLALALWAIWIRLFADAAVPGWASTVVPIYFLGGVQLLCIGIIGEYLAKTYIEVKGRPRFFIERVLGSVVHTPDRVARAREPTDA